MRAAARRAGAEGPGDTAAQAIAGGESTVQASRGVPSASADGRWAIADRRGPNLRPRLVANIRAAYQRFAATEVQ